MQVRLGLAALGLAALGGAAGGLLPLKSAASAMVLAVAAPPVAAVLTEIPAGDALYGERCAACHDAGDATKAPSLSSLRAMPASHVRFVLTDGAMAPMAEGLTSEEIEAVVSYVSAPAPQANPRAALVAAASGPAPQAATGPSTAAAPVASAAWIDAIRCAAGERSVDLSGRQALTSYAVDPGSQRRLTAERSGLTNAQLADLEVAWVLPIPEATTLRAQGVIVGDTLFYAAPQASTVLALDAATGCVKWDYPSPSPLRTSLTFGEIRSDGAQALIFGDARGTLRALDPATGVQIWATDPRHDRTAPLTGAPILHEGKVIVPVSASDVGRAADPNYQCCTSHGAVVMVDASDGSKVWTHHTTDNAAPIGRNNGRGVEWLGPSGAPVWSTPTVDVERGLIYATTGQNTSPPATGTSDAVLALDMKTGELRWSFQGLSRDIWNLACGGGGRNGPNCAFTPEESVQKDYDFGASVIVARTSQGKGILLAGQKSGHLWALDPDDKGAVLWSHAFGEGTALGGIHWGIASDGRRVFAPVNDPAYPGRPGDSGMNAVDIDTGEIVWRWKAAADCDEGRAALVVHCDTKFGLSAAPLVVDQAVLAGSLDGKLWIFDAASGEVIFTYDTIRTYEGLGGLTGRGGAIDSHSVFAGAGMVFVGSGYGSFNQQPGNVLIALRPKTVATGQAQ